MEGTTNDTIDPLRLLREYRREIEGKPRRTTSGVIAERISKALEARANRLLREPDERAEDGTQREVA